LGRSLASGVSEREYGCSGEKISSNVTGDSRTLKVRWEYKYKYTYTRKQNKSNKKDTSRFKPFPKAAAAAAVAEFLISQPKHALDVHNV
jgi:hypothetical protein